MPNALLHKLDMPPRDSKGFLWADYVELRCLTSQDGLYGEGHVVDLETEAEELMVDVEADIEEFLVGDEADEQGGEDNAIFRNNESVARKWADIGSRLNSRMLSMQGYWPFEFREGILYRQYDSANPKHVLYVALLIASALRYCNKKRQGEVAASLEEIGYHIFRAIMPAGWEVRPFGAHQNIANGFEGTLAQKLASLGEHIFPTFIKPADQFDDRNTGDGGLDVVAWHPLGDAVRGHIPVVFAQCGCSPGDWEHKQFEATPVSMELKISPQHPASSFYIMPHDMRNLTGGWERGEHLGRVILLDRLRIIKLVEQYELPGAFPNWPFVQEASELRMVI